MVSISGGCKSGIKVSQGWVCLSQASPPALGGLPAISDSLACGCIPPVSAVTFTGHPPCVRVYLCAQVSPLYQDSCHTGLEAQPPPVRPHLNCSHLQGHYFHFHSECRALGLEQMHFGGQNSTHNGLPLSYPAACALVTWLCRVVATQ